MMTDENMPVKHSSCPGYVEKMAADPVLADAELLRFDRLAKKELDKKIQELKDKDIEIAV